VISCNAVQYETASDDDDDRGDDGIPPPGCCVQIETTPVLHLLLS